MEPSFDEYGDPIVLPSPPLWFTAAALLYLLISPILETLTRKALVIAALRVSMGVIIMLMALALPGFLAKIVNFVGHMFLFVALYGLISPVEAKITGTLADVVIGKRAN